MGDDAPVAIVIAPFSVSRQEPELCSPPVTSQVIHRHRTRARGKKPGVGINKQLKEA